MKVRLGPYRSWVGPYQIAAFFLTPFFKDKEDDRIFNAGEWLARTPVGKVCDWIDKRKQRRISVKIDPYDVWGLDHTLALIIHPALLVLKAQDHGAPAVDDEDVPEELRRAVAPPVENEWDTDELFFKRWDFVMDEMIWTFEHLASDDGDDLEYGSEYLTREERVKSGLRLFGKYYRGLWD